MKTARIRKDARPHGGRIATVVNETTLPNGRQVVSLILGRHEIDLSHWTQKFGRLSHTVLEYSPHELTLLDGSPYAFATVDLPLRARLCRNVSVEDAARLAIDAELERRTGEPHIDGWPLYSGLPPAAIVAN